MYASNLSAEIVRYTDSMLLLAGEFDLASEDVLERALADWVRDGGPMTLEMSAVTFVDSSAIHVLLRSLKRSPSGCLVLHGVTTFVEKTLALIGATTRPGLHVTPCSDRDPYPAGRALARDVEGRDLLGRLAKMRADHERQRIAVRRNADTSVAAIAKAREIRAAVAARRSRVAA